ncbi:MAG: DUF2914 domain-containing protein [Gammaproteobacteria bacterium]|nr:MAG: DUF2914 domain-containing protein [Gammaproteobacteria bacterium]UCH41714.1 MAG: DUF2914 domain-containing protein [Gammaproteobacteria bacterium]
MRPLIKSLVLTAALVISSNAFAGNVARAIFTIGVDNHEPVIMVDSIDSSSYQSISFFTELSDLTGHNVTHQWTFNDQVMFEKTFEVKGPRWRVWTSKTLVPSWTGSWTVNVLDDDRTVLASKSFEYQ